MFRERLRASAVTNLTTRNRAHQLLAFAMREGRVVLFPGDPALGQYPFDFLDDVLLVEREVVVRPQIRRHRGLDWGVKPAAMQVRAIPERPQREVLLKDVVVVQSVQVGVACRGHREYQEEEGKKC